jgi:serine/threonine protein kinase
LQNLLRIIGGGNVHEVGDVIDIWVIDKALGSGGMGSVYRCHNRSAHRILAAIKVLDIPKNETVQARFVREAEILFSLNHPNIVKVRNIRPDTTPPYIEMEFIEGHSLSHLIQSSQLTIDKAIKTLHDLASAIQFLHASGVRHRDIKPGNVLVQDDGTAKLVDFGLAMETNKERITQSNITFGTLTYAPPEWIDPERLNPALWDIYSFGVLAYELLTGVGAFPSTGGSAKQSAVQTMMAKQDHPPLDVGTMYSKAMRTWVKRLTMSQAPLRYQNMQEVFADFQSLVTTSVLNDSSLDPATVHIRGRPIPQPTLSIRKPESPTFYIDEGNGEREEYTPPKSESVSEPVSAPEPVPKRPGRKGAFIAITLLVLLGAGLFAILWAQSEAPLQTVQITLRGVPEGIPADVSLDTVLPVRSHDHTFTFDPVPNGARTVQYTLGKDCLVQHCPGPECPQWCFTDSSTIELVEEGDPLIAHVNLPVDYPQPGEILFSSPALQEKKLPVALTITGGSQPLVTPMTLEPVLLYPGTYQVLAIAGTCPEDTPTCLSSQQCPKECSATLQEFTVLPTGDSIHIQLDMELPQTKEKKKLFNGIKLGSKRGNGSRTGQKALVTHGQFARWLKKNADWHPEKARNKAVADKNFLRTWSGLVPPVGSSSRPVVHVSWYAATAYCGRKGGLADVADPPTRWDETGTGVAFEWRVDKGKAVFLESNGQPSSAVVRKQSNAFTGFRCVK